MKRTDIRLTFTIGRNSRKDPYIYLEGNDTNDTQVLFYYTDVNKGKLADAECLRALAEYATKKAEEYEKAANAA